MIYNLWESMVGPKGQLPFGCQSNFLTLLAVDQAIEDAEPALLPSHERTGTRSVAIHKKDVSISDVKQGNPWDEHRFSGTVRSTFKTQGHLPSACRASLEGSLNCKGDKRMRKWGLAWRGYL